MSATQSFVDRAAKDMSDVMEKEGEAINFEGLLDFIERLIAIFLPMFGGCAHQEAVERMTSPLGLRDRIRLHAAIRLEGQNLTFLQKLAAFRSAKNTLKDTTPEEASQVLNELALQPPIPA